METLTNPNHFAPAPGGQGKQHSFFGAVFAGLMLLFLTGILYFTQLTDFSSPFATSAEQMENLPTVQDAKGNAPVTGSVNTTANMASHPMFVPLLKQQLASAPLVFR